jgi:hypothetical protein
MSIMNRWTVAGAAVVMQLGLGSLYAWSVFRQPLSAHYGASVTSVNVAFFVAIFVFGISTLAAGLLLRGCYEPVRRMPAACWRKRQANATK